MNKIKTPSLNGDKIVEQYPLSMVAYKKWLGAFPNVEEAGLGKDGLIYENSLKAVFYFNPRSLYDFFDHVGIEIEISRSLAPENWYYLFSNADSDSLPFKTRILAEESAFQKAFELLEEKLKKS